MIRLRKHIAFFLFGMIMLHNMSHAQTHYAFKGTVVDEDNVPLTGASVLLFSENKVAVTDAKGDFVIEGLPAGKHEVEISFVGFETLLDTFQLVENKEYVFQLDVRVVSLQEVVVTDNLAETRKGEESLNIEIVNDEYLKQNLGGSVMKSLERLPGVSTIDIGSGQSKPVIRGLGFNRVLVIENNIKHEAQQWGTDHGLEIDQYAIDYIEVIKGPASLQYGSDAIGGVIDMKNRKLPAENSLGGSIDLTGKTNNDFLGSSISLYGRKKWFFADVRATLLDYGDYKVPTDSVDIHSYRAPLYKNHLRNTAGKEQNWHASFGVIQKRFQSKFFISSINSKSGFFANAHGLEPLNVDTDLHDKSNRDILLPYQKVNHFKAISTNLYRWEDLKLEFDLGFQRNFRQEWSRYDPHDYMPATFPDTLNFDAELERQFEKYVYSGTLKFRYQPFDKTQLNFGLNSEYQNNQIDGRGFIIPAYNQFNIGVFVLGKHQFSEESFIQAGLRYDYGQLNTSEYYDWYLSPNIENGDTSSQYLQRADDIHRSFSSLSWSVGYHYHAGAWSYKANIGKSFRMPIAKELAANGVNYRIFRVEKGSADLSPEISYQLDLGIEYHSRKLAIGTTPFLNYFTNYIYLSPGSEIEKGNQVFYYTQSEVLRYGTELHAHYEMFKFLQLGIMGEYVYAEQLSGEKKGFALPFSPPLSGIFNVKFQKQKLGQKPGGKVENIYFSIDYRMTAAQKHIVPPEEITEGFQLINLGLGGDLVLKGQLISINMQVHNLLNTKYFNHTSFYRLINVPEAGRNFIVHLSIPFSGKLKQEQ